MGARSFDGTNDVITVTAHASIDGFSNLTIASYFIHDTDSNQIPWAKSDNIDGWDLRIEDAAAGDGLRFRQQFTTTNGQWQSTTTNLGTGTIHQMVVTYTPGPSPNQPTIYVNGASESVTELNTPDGTLQGDSGVVLTFGEQGGGAFDFAGDLSCVCYDSQIWTAAHVNRHRWYGVAPGGPSTVAVWHPFWTDSLLNKGTATADGSNAGSVMASTIPRCERMWGATMGVGR